MAKKSEVSKVMRAMVKKRWAKTNKQERSAHMRKMAQARWSKKKGQ